MNWCASGRRLAIAAACGFVSTAAAAPQTFNTALPVAAGEFVFREQLLYREATGDPTPANRELGVLGAVSVLGYGASANFALFGALPYLYKEMNVTLSNGRHITRAASGLGDMRLFARYIAWKHDAPGRAFRIAPYAGVELPTGDNKDRDRFGPPPPPLQPGSGSWDFFGGVVATWQTLDYQLDAQASYQVNNEASNFEFGDVLRLDASHGPKETCQAGCIGDTRGRDICAAWHSLVCPVRAGA